MACRVWDEVGSFDDSIAIQNLMKSWDYYIIIEKKMIIWRSAAYTQYMYLQENRVENKYIFFFSSCSVFFICSWRCRCLPFIVDRSAKWSFSSTSHFDGSRLAVIFLFTFIEWILTYLYCNINMKHGARVLYFRFEWSHRCRLQHLTPLTPIQIASNFCNRFWYLLSNMQQQ